MSFPHLTDMSGGAAWSGPSSPWGALMEEWGAKQGLVTPYFRAMAATLASPKGWVPPPSPTGCQGGGMRAHSLKAPQGSHLGVGKQRHLGDKVWEVTGEERMYVLSLGL